jgi:hypothetical protein
MTACANTPMAPASAGRRGRLVSAISGVSSLLAAVALLPCLAASPALARAADLERGVIVDTATLTLGLALAEDAEPSPAPAAPTIAAVTPAEFAAGTVITISGQNFAEGDIVLLDSKALTDLKITATSITGTVPTAAKLGKKLILKRAKKKVGELVGSSDGVTRFTFVPAPKLTTITPKFAAPGDTVTLKGKGLQKVTELNLGATKLKIDEQTDTAIKFTAVDGNQTGALTVKSLGGEAALKKDYEVFYAPILASVDPPAAFEGDAITIAGAHLAAASKTAAVKFKLGTKSLKIAETTATAAKSTVPKGAKTGPVTATARGKKASLAADFTVHRTPLLTTVPKEVGAPGELKVSGKHLDAVTTWRLGQVTLTPVAPATGSKVTLTIPADAPLDQPLIAVTQGREFASKKPVATVRTPIVQGLAFWTGPRRQGRRGRHPRRRLLRQDQVHPRRQVAQDQLRRRRPRRLHPHQGPARQRPEAVRQGRQVRRRAGRGQRRRQRLPRRPPTSSPRCSPPSACKTTTSSPPSSTSRSASTWSATPARPPSRTPSPPASPRSACASPRTSSASPSPRPRSAPR